jgi:branched-chain amino acid transport system ATP-binding protein
VTATLTVTLAVTGLTRCFGTLTAVDHLDLHVNAGSRHALIGPNGAGKTTVLDLVTGTVAATAGRIVVNDRDITRMPVHRRARVGLARTWQHPQVCASLNALDNVVLADGRRDGFHARSVWRPTAYRQRVDQARDLLDRVGLHQPARRVPAGQLSHGQRRMLELACALAGQPRLLLLDEPAAGLTDADTARLVTILTGLPDTVTVLLIEHDLDVVAAIADTVTVLDAGRHLATGTPADIHASPAVQTAYLGVVR